MDQSDLFNIAPSLVYDVAELDERVDGKSAEVICHDEDPALGLHVLPDARLARVQLALHVLLLQGGLGRRGGALGRRRGGGQLGQRVATYSRVL